MVRVRGRRVPVSGVWRLGNNELVLCLAVFVRLCISRDLVQLLTYTITLSF